jgi:hypothetical protein
MARPAAHRPPTEQEMQTSLSRWQNVLLHISSAWGEPGAPTWHGPVVMARYRLDALAAAQEIGALLERMVTAHPLLGFGRAHDRLTFECCA